MIIEDFFNQNWSSKLVFFSNLEESFCKTHDSSQGFIFRNGRFDRYFRVEYVSEHVYWADASPVYELRGVMCTQVYDDNVMNTAEKNELSEYMEVCSTIFFYFYAAWS